MTIPPRPLVVRTPAAVIIDLGDGDRIVAAPELEGKIRNMVERPAAGLGCFILALVLGAFVAGAFFAVALGRFA